MRNTLLNTQEHTLTIIYMYSISIQFLSDIKSSQKLTIIYRYSEWKIYIKSVNHHIKVHFEESKPLYATIPKGWAIETPVIVFTSSPSKFECCILFKKKIKKKNYHHSRFTGKFKLKNLFRKPRKSKAIPVKVSIYPEESVSVEVYAETIGPAQLVLSDFGHISAVTKSSGNVRTLHGILHPVREK